MRLKVWFLETRPQFLTLSVVLAFLGATIAWYYGPFNLWYAVLAGFGLVVAHASVNIINDYFDYKSGIDLAAKRTPFSGGSGILPTGLLTPKQALWLGLGALIVTIPIGIYFIVVRSIWLLPLLIVAAFFILLYSPFILKRPWPEWAAGAGLGTLPILGLYFVQTGTYKWQVLVAAIPSFFLVHNLLLLNEFPDAEADTKANRKTLPLTIGKKNAAIFYTVVALAVYVWIIAWVIISQFLATEIMPTWTLLVLLTTPLVFKAIKGAWHNDDPSKLMPGLAANVIMMLLIQLLLGIGFILGRIF
jgi:1,4-dihydroxy-2-naphthoate polyprenyltransferase